MAERDRVRVIAPLACAWPRGDERADDARGLGINGLAVILSARGSRECGVELKGAREWASRSLKN